MCFDATNSRALAQVWLLQWFLEIWDNTSQVKPQMAALCFLSSRKGHRVPVVAWWMQWADLLQHHRGNVKDVLGSCKTNTTTNDTDGNYETLSPGSDLYLGSSYWDRFPPIFCSLLWYKMYLLINIIDTKNTVLELEALQEHIINST